MKYMKSIFIFFIILNLSALCASLIEPIAIDDKTGDFSVEETDTIENNELQDWHNHLETLAIKGDNWVADNNIPTDDWTTKAFTLAENAMATDNTFAATLKNSFNTAIKEKIIQENGNITLSPEILMEKFDKKIEDLKNPTPSEPIIETQQESEKSKIKIVPTQNQSIPLDTQSEQTTEPEISSIISTDTPATETIPTSSESPEIPQETKKEDKKPQQEKKEDLNQEWTDCLNNMQKSTNNLYESIEKAIELGKKLLISNPMNIQKILPAFEKSLEGALAVRGLPANDKDMYQRYFTDELMPRKEIITQPQPSMPAMPLQKIQEKEKTVEAELKAMQKKEMTMQAALQAVTNLSDQKTIEFDRWRKIQENLKIAEQKKLELLQKDAQLLKMELEETVAQQKRMAEKSLFTRAKETVTSFIWGQAENQELTEKSISEKKTKLEQLQQQILQEEATLYEQTCQINKQKARAEKIKELTGRELTKIEIKRKAELEKEEKECAAIKAKKEFDNQRIQWHNFLQKLAENKQASIQDNEKAVIEAIKRAGTLLELIPLFSPSKYIIEVEKGLKIAFANALLDEQRNNKETINIFNTQSRFDHAINDIKNTLLKINQGQF